MQIERGEMKRLGENIVREISFGVECSEIVLHSSRHSNREEL